MVVLPSLVEVVAAFGVLFWVPSVVRPVGSLADRYMQLSGARNQMETQRVVSFAPLS